MAWHVMRRAGRIASLSSDRWRFLFILVFFCTPRGIGTRAGVLVYDFWPFVLLPATLDEKEVFCLFLVCVCLSDLGLMIREIFYFFV